MHGILPTSTILETKGLQLDTICRTCGEEEESADHLFFTVAPVQWQISQNQANGFQKWWTSISNLPSTATNQARLELTAHILWAIWKLRNDWYFPGLHRTCFLCLARRASYAWQEFKDLQVRKQELKMRSMRSSPSQTPD